MARFERAGLFICGMRYWRTVPKELAENHYSDLLDRFPKHPEYFRRNIRNLQDGPVVAIALAGHGAVQKVRLMVGATWPNEAAPGTIRHDFACDNQDHTELSDCACANAVHAAAGFHDARREIKLWFGKIPEE